MKTTTSKLVFILCALFCTVSFSIAEKLNSTVIFNENCSGNGSQQSPNTQQKSVGSFTNWSAIGLNGVTITSYSTTSADVRTNTILTSTGTLVDNNHIYMPAKDVLFAIKNINTSSYSDVKFTFDMAGGSASTSVTQNFNEIEIYYKVSGSTDSVRLNINAKLLLSTEKNWLLNAGEYAIPSTNNLTLVFKNTLALAKIFRLDNIVISGTPITSTLNLKSSNLENSVFANSGFVKITNKKNTKVSIYTVSGSLLKSAMINSDDFNIYLPQGIYVVDIDTQKAKVIVK